MSRLERLGSMATTMQYLNQGTLSCRVDICKRCYTVSTLPFMERRTSVVYRALHLKRWPTWVGWVSHGTENRLKWTNLVLIHITYTGKNSIAVVEHKSLHKGVHRVSHDSWGNVVGRLAVDADDKSKLEWRGWCELAAIDHCQTWRQGHGRAKVTDGHSRFEYSCKGFALIIYMSSIFRHAFFISNFFEYFCDLRLWFLLFLFLNFHNWLS